MTATIRAIKARQILDSRANPTVEAEALLDGGACGRAAVPSGASTGSREAVELRDGGEEFAGRGVTQAIAAIADTIAPALAGRSALDQEAIDLQMADLDGTAGKYRLGANAILAVSLAVARAAAAHVGMPLYRYLGGPGARVLPTPMLNVLNGGAHAANPLDVQEFMLVPGGFPSFSEALRAGVEVYQNLKKILSGRGLGTNVGDEGGFAPDLARSEDALELLVEAVESAGYRPGEEIALALDVAATEVYEDGAYRIDGQTFDMEGVVTFYEKLAAGYPIVSIEDGMAEDDWPGWAALTGRLGTSTQLVGDDLFVTDERTVRRGVAEGVANAVLIKVNQIGSLSETLHTMETARSSGYGRVVSHRSGEPIIFGPSQDKAVVWENGEAAIVDRASVDPSRIIVHDVHAESPAQAFALSRISHGPYGPTPLGLFRDVQRPVYEQAMEERNQNVTAAKGEGRLEDLLASHGTWTAV